MTNVDVAVDSAPADHVGGDICDIFEADSGRTALVVGDVSGKGIAAGLLSGIIYGAVHSSSWTASPFQHEDATERLNDLLRRKTSADRFASLFWGYYEPESSSFHYINAGHLPMLLVHIKDGRVHIERLEKGGPVLGVVEWGNYQQGQAAIEEGDLLILFSDGIVEAMNEGQQQFGEDRLLNVIHASAEDSPSDLQDAILAAVQDHTGKNGQHDDQTVVVARFHHVCAGIATSMYAEA
jgi:sigma-B regulation protein RsbU (phosphoserine phosphatase)